MPTTPDLLIEIGNRHQVHLNKMYSGVANQYDPFLKQIAKTVRTQLLNTDITDWKRARLEKFLYGINKDLLIIQNEYIDDIFIPSSLSLGKSEAAFEVKSLEQVVKYDFTIPTEGQLKSAVLTNPLNVTGSNHGQLLFNYIKRTTIGTTDLIVNNIRSGVYSGQTTQQIIRNIIGTKSKLFRDGTLYNVNRDIGTMVRTGLAHVSAQARTETWKRNSDISPGFKISVTFDGNTSVICRGYGSTPDKIYTVGVDPVNPFHLNCRSSTVAALNEKFKMLEDSRTRSARNADGKIVSVPANENYYTWLKRQPAAFQDDVIGKTRGQLLRNGGLTVEQFSKLNLNKFGVPRKTIFRGGKALTPLEQMREVEELAFSKIE